LREGVVVPADFPFDTIKIDTAFTSNLHRNRQSAAIVGAAIGLGRALNVPIVAEGVETKEQMGFLGREAAMGCKAI